MFCTDQVETDCGGCWWELGTVGRAGGIWTLGVVLVRCTCYSRALPQRFLPGCSDLPVAVNHLHHQPELQPDDGDVHHHLGQDGRLAPGHWVDEETEKVRGSDCDPRDRLDLIWALNDVGRPGGKIFKRREA